MTIYLEQEFKISHHKPLLNNRRGGLTNLLRYAAFYHTWWQIHVPKILWFHLCISFWDRLWNSFRMVVNADADIKSSRTFSCERLLITPTHMCPHIFSPETLFCSAWGHHPLQRSHGYSIDIKGSWLRGVWLEIAGFYRNKYGLLSWLKWYK